jgi:hypothetical protein
LVYFGGIVFIIWGVSLVLNSNATLDVNGVPSKDPWIKSIVLIVGLVVGVLGVLLLIARPYRPDLRDPSSPKVMKQLDN